MLGSRSTLYSHLIQEIPHSKGSLNQVALRSPYQCIPSPPMNELFSCPFTPVSTQFNSHVLSTP